MSAGIITIDGKEIPKIVGYDVQYGKLWADDTGRNMSGEMKGTLIGIFPKITLSIGSTTDVECKALSQIFNKANLLVSWYDVEKGFTENISYYCNDFEPKLKYKHKRTEYKPFSINLIPNRRR
jgi:hypothetical protein